MNTPKNNFTIIPNWLVDELSSGAEFSLYCKMYNGWCLMKGPDGWYYRSLSKLKEDLGMSPKTNNNRLLERIKKFEELGILMVERCDRQTNRYKFNEDYMFNHEEDTADEVVPQTGTSVVPETGISLVPETGISLVPETGTVYNTVSNNTVKNNIYKEKEINKEKESNTAGQGSLRNNGVSISSLTNEGDNSIQSEGERDRQGIDVTVSLSSKSNKGKNKSNTFNDKKDLQNTGLHSNLHQAIAPFRGESDSEPPQISDLPPLMENAMTREMANDIIKNLGDWYADGAEIVEHEPHKFMIELQHEIPFLELTNIIPDYIMRHGMDIKDIIILRQDDGKCCSKFEMYFNQPDLDNCVLSDEVLSNEQEYQNIEKCRQEAPYAILSNSGHSFTSEPMVMYGT